MGVMGIFGMLVMEGMEGMIVVGMGGMVMDLNDFNFDVYLVNDWIFFDFEIVVVEKGGWVLLCVINGVVVMVFWIVCGDVLV